MDTRESGQMRVAVTGAFERDNFGDLLYPMLLCEAWSNWAELSLVSRLPATTEHLLGMPIGDYDTSLRRTQFDAIVLAGGASVPLTMGTACSFLPTGSSLSETDPFGLPYVPEIAAGSRNADTPVFINSVNVWPTGNLRVKHRRRLILALHQAQQVSVRDRASAEFLHRSWGGIPAVLGPDSVHALSRYWEFETSEGPRSLVIQLSDEYLDEVGDEAAVAGLCSAMAQLGDDGFRKIVFFAAGVVPGHDDLERMRRIADATQMRHPDWDVQVDDARSPLAIVELIATADLVMGHSLHVRIVAAAYGVPRISLKRGKTEDYARNWDPEMPAGVAPTDMADSAQRALSLSVRRRADDDSERLTRRAVVGLESLGGEIRHWAHRRQEVAARRSKARRQYGGGVARLSDFASSAQRRVRAKIGV